MAEEKQHHQNKRSNPQDITIYSGSTNKLKGNKGTRPKANHSWMIAKVLHKTEHFLYRK